MREDLQIGYSALKITASNARAYMDYYKGNQPLKFSIERLREVFNKPTVKFVQNWCCVVVDAVHDRLVFKGWDSTDDNVTKQIQDDIYNKYQIQKLSRKVHLDTLITGSGYLMFDEVDGEVKPYYNSPENILVVYADDDEEKKAFAIKSWYDTREKIRYINLYYDDHIEKYSGKKDSSIAGMKLDQEVTNPFQRIPVVHFKLDSLELANIIPLQDAINKMFSDMMVVGEFGAFPQRWAVTNAELSALQFSPSTFLGIPKGMGTDEEQTQIGEFGVANLNMYLQTMESVSNSVAIISRTPKHYFMNTGANISGEALVVMESPLVKKTEQYIENFSTGWMDLLSYYREDTEDITTVWDKPQTKQVETEARAMKEMFAMGIPLATICRRFGWGDDEIAQMLADMEEQETRNAELSKQALEIAKMKFEQENNPF